MARRYSHCCGSHLPDRLETNKSKEKKKRGIEKIEKGGNKNIHFGSIYSQNKTIEIKINSQCLLNALCIFEKSEISEIHLHN